MKKSLFIAASTMVIVIAGLSFNACEREKTDPLLIDDRIVENRENADTLVYPPDAKPYGKSYKDWTVSWMRQFLTFNTTKAPVNPYTKESLDLQNSPVWFLPRLCNDRLDNTAPANTIKVPRGKAILFPIVNYINNYPCPNSPLQPSRGQSLEDFLRKGAKNAMANVMDLYVEIDGHSIPNPKDYQFTSGLFTFTGDPSLASCFDACITGLQQRAVTSGFYMMVKPLKIGFHTIRYHARIRLFNTVQDGIFNIAVI